MVSEFFYKDFIRQFALGDGTNVENLPPKCFAFSSSGEKGSGPDTLIHIYGNQLVWT